MESLKTQEALNPMAEPVPDQGGSRRMREPGHEGGSTPMGGTKEGGAKGLMGAKGGRAERLAVFIR